MGYRIIPRSEWGFNGWGSTPNSRTMNAWKYMTVHYEGSARCGHQVGPSVPRGIHAFHKNGRGWAGIGYNFVIDQAGNIFEGRGFQYQGAHKPSGVGSNSCGLGVQMHIGGSEEPSSAAIAALMWLHGEAERRTGSRLAWTWHGEGFSTDCPGGPLIQLVKRVRSGNVPSMFAAAAAAAKPSVLYVNGELDSVTVSALQRHLNSVSKSAPVVVDGEMGPNTIRKLQGVVGVRMDGIVGPATVRAIEAWAGVSPSTMTGWYPGLIRAIQRRKLSGKEMGGGESAKREASVTPPPVAVTGRLDAPTVSALQTELNARDRGRYGDIAADGVMGQGTVRKLQWMSGAEQTGVFDAQTARAVERWLGAKSESVPGWYPGLIRALQRWLIGE